MFSLLQEKFPLTKVEKKENKVATDVWKAKCVCVCLSLSLSLVCAHTHTHCLPALSSALDMEGDGPPSKKARTTDDTDFSMASLAKGEVTEVSSCWSHNSYMIPPTPGGDP